LIPRHTLALPHGRLVAVDVPPALTDELRDALHPDELAHALTLGPGRQPTFAAGRVALRAALAAIASDATEAARLTGVPYLPDSDGAPTLPPGVRASISHKRTLAVALAAPAEPNGAPATLGVDLEDDRALRVDISRRVLTAAERTRVAALPPEGRDRGLIGHFALKEAFYKAVNGFRLAHVSFQNVEVSEISADGAVRFAGPLLLEQQLAINGWLGNPIAGYIVASVRARAHRQSRN
jgi:phosphopantetheine--protein transferase-like protein